MCVRGCCRPNRNCNILTPLLWPSALYLSRSPGLLNRRPRGPLCWRGLSLPHLVSNSSDLQLFWSPNSIGGPKGPFGRVWLSLPHIVSYLSCLQLTGLLSTPSYIIVQSPTQSPAQSLEWHVWLSCSSEVTLFRYISLWVHHGLLTCPFRQPNLPYAISFDYWPLGCVTSFRWITLEWHVWLGRRSIYNTNSLDNQRKKRNFLN